MKWLFAFLFCVQCTALMSQGNLIIISGVVKNASTQETIPYATIYSSDRTAGTISNEVGLFVLHLHDSTDSLFVTSIGFERSSFAIQSTITSYEIQMRELSYELNEVVVRPGDQDLLFDLLEKCKKGRSGMHELSKAYFELKSFDGSQQIELVEGYYNALIDGYDIDELRIKSGRLAVQPVQGQYFVSLDGTKAISMREIFRRNVFFPMTPLELSRKLAKKHFYLTKEGSHQDDQGNHVIQIAFEPKDAADAAFKGKMYINEKENLLVQIEYGCDDCKEYPFIPLFPDDSIASVNMRLIQNMDHSGRPAQMSMKYDVAYYGKKPDSTLSYHHIYTKAILHLYDYGTKFFEPKFNFPSGLNDYKKLNAIPYNASFWTNNSNLHIDANAQGNEAFFNDVYSVTNNQLFQKKNEMGNQFLRYAYVKWSPVRISLSEAVEDTTSSYVHSLPISEQYRLKVHLFMDRNTIADSVQISTACILDPYESFYHLPIDSVTKCFFNLYFDLCEIQRIELEKQLNLVKQDEQEVLNHYNRFLIQHDQYMYEFLKEVDRGTNKKMMLKWNEFVITQNGIDNLKLFNVYQSQQ